MMNPNHPSHVSRRQALKLAFAAPAGLSLLTRPSAFAQNRPPVVMFSKHLQHLNYERMAEAIGIIGFDGADLTVRKGGHVLPENVGKDLPKAVQAVRDAGFEVPMITTGISSAEEPHTEAILRTASELGIRYYRIGTWKYDYKKDIVSQLQEWNEKMKKLAELNHKYSIVAGYHNHSGNGYIGGPIWDLYEMLNGVDPAWIGSNFDTGHAVVEGGGGAWITNFHLIKDRIKMSAVKDFFWEKSEKGWRSRFCPMGKGMVDWKKAFGMFKEIGFSGPFSYHMEYETAGSTEEEKQKNLLADLKQDLQFTRSIMQSIGW